MVREHHHIIISKNSDLLFCCVFQLSSTFGLLPSVLLTYIGQAAYLRKHMDMDISNAFFNSVPSNK